MATIFSHCVSVHLVARTWLSNASVIRMGETISPFKLIEEMQDFLVWYLPSRLYLTCVGYPGCKTVMWFPQSVLEAKVDDELCNQVNYCMQSYSILLIFCNVIVLECIALTIELFYLVSCVASMSVISVLN